VFTKKNALMAELCALEAWDQAAEKFTPKDEITRVGIKARQMRRLAIISEINNLLKVDAPEQSTD
jgi:hypothetical protein